jgi:hypothetical protein
MIDIVPVRVPIYEPPQGRDGYQIESWIERQVQKGAVLRTRDGNPIRLSDAKLQAFLDHGVEGGSFITGTSEELIYANLASGTAKNTFTTEVGINDTAGMGAVAHVPVDFWTNSNVPGRVLKITASGIVSSTGTPTFTFTTRVGTQLNITAAIIAGTAALTTASGAANGFWRCEALVVLTVIGAAGANSTVRGTGQHTAGSNAFTTNAGSNFYNAGASATAPSVATVDTSITNYINFNVACSASSASNGVTLHQLIVEGLN